MARTGGPKTQEGPSPIQGLPAPMAWRQLLNRLGGSGATPPEADLTDGENAPNEILQKLRGCGLAGRFVQVHPDALGRLSLPTLILAAQEEWVLIVRKRRKNWLIEDFSGSRFVSEAALSRAYNGTALELETAFPEEGSLWVRLLKLIPKNARFLWMSLATSALVQLLSLLSPWMTAWMVDGALARGAWSMLQILCIGILLITLFKAWITWLREITLNAFTAKVDVTTEKGLFEHLLHLPYKHLQRKSLGELLQAFSGIKRARAIALNRGLTTIFDSSTAATYLICLVMLMPSATAVVLLGALVMGGTSTIVGYLQARIAQHQIEASQAAHSALAELIKGAPTLKATGSQRWVLERWRKRLSLELSHSLRQERLRLWETSITEVLTQGTSIYILIWGGFKVLAGELSLGQLLAFSQLSTGFLTTMGNLSQTVLAFALAKPQMTQAIEVFATNRQTQEHPTEAPLPPGTLLAEDIWFRYEEKGPWILKGVNLKVEPDTFHHLKGESGSGKSTFLKLLAGLYPPETGRISMSDSGGKTNFQQLAFLPQFPQLSSGSILDNLKIFSSGQSKTHILQISNETGLNEWIKTLPMGYNTRIASGGANLSGGQRQLIAITAILASNKQFILLDEALSNLDWVSRQKILKSSRLKGRTVIYASHEEILPKQ